MTFVKFFFSIGLFISASPFASVASVEETNELKFEIVESDKKSHYKKEDLRFQISILNYQIEETERILKIRDFAQRNSELEKLSENIKFKEQNYEATPYLQSINIDSESDLKSLEQKRMALRLTSLKQEGPLLNKRGDLQRKASKLRKEANLSLNEFQDRENLILAKELERKKELAIQQELERKFLVLGDCEIGNSVYHREVWNTKTSSGNIIADGLFGAASKETFIITYEAIVESFLGSKVKTIINDYKIQQTLGGGILDQKTYRKYDIAEHADKYIGKVQFYEKSRCN